MEITIEEYRKAISVVLAYKEQLNKRVLELHSQLTKTNLIGVPTHETKIIDTDISARLRNVLRYSTESYTDKNWRDITVGDLANVSKKEFLKGHQIGPKLLAELIEVTSLAGIELKD